jgi:chromosome segregation ATPase
MIALAMEPGEHAADVAIKKTQRDYVSRKGALVWSLGKSRDNWKNKYSQVKAQLDASQRKLKYALSVKEAAAVEITALRAELAAEKAKAESLATQLAECPKKRDAACS